MIKNQKGFGIIEVLVSLALIAIVMVSLGKILTSIYKLYNASELKTKAYSYAQESLEILNNIKNNQFACVCSVDSCAAGSCTRISDGQSCDLIGAYTSCWTQYPKNLTGSSFYFDPSWQLLVNDDASYPNGHEVATNSTFWRKITITNVLRNADGDIDTTGTMDTGTKKITVTVTYLDRGEAHQVALSTLLTAWQNL